MRFQFACSAFMLACLVGTASCGTKAQASINLIARLESLKNLYTIDNDDTKFLAKPYYYFKSKRRLDTKRPCNTLISTVSTDEIRALLGIYFAALQQPADMIVSALNYNVDVYKVCGQCSTVKVHDSAANASSFGSFASYCGPDFYGSDAVHSSLAFVPTTQDNMIPSGYLRTLMVMHGTDIDAKTSETDDFPTSLGAEIAALNLTNFEEVGSFLGSHAENMSPLVSASMGAVSMIPDNLGYGESLGTHNRTYFYHESYMQAATVSWFAAQDLVKNLTNKCTLLDKTITIQGTSEGAYAAMAIAHGFRNLGFAVLGSFAGAGVFSPEQQVRDMIRDFDSGDASGDALFVNRVALPFSVFGSSIDTPGLANSNTGQRTVHPDWNMPGKFSRNIIDWFKSPEPLGHLEVLDLMPQDPTRVLVPAIRELFLDAIASNITSPCAATDLIVENVTDKICEYLLQVDGLFLVNETTTPTLVCWSPEDTVSLASQVPDYLFENPLVMLQEIQGDHFAASLTCPVFTLLFLVDPTIPERPTLIRPLKGSDAAVCSMNNTIPPTASPMEETVEPTATQDASPAARVQAWIWWDLSAIFLWYPLFGMIEWPFSI